MTRACQRRPWPFVGKSIRMKKFQHSSCCKWVYMSLQYVVASSAWLTAMWWKIRYVWVVLSIEVFFHMTMLYLDILQAFAFGMQSFRNAIPTNSTVCHPRFSKSLSCFASLPWHCPSNSLMRATLLWMLWVPGRWNWRSLGSSMVAPGDLWVWESRHAKCHVHAAMHLIDSDHFRSASGMMHSLSAVRKATCGHCKRSMISMPSMSMPVKGYMRPHAATWNC